MLGTVSVFLGIAVIALAGLLIWRERRAAVWPQAAQRLEEIARVGGSSQRMSGAGVAEPMAASANLILEQLKLQELQLRQRERMFDRLLEGLHEAVAVHSDVVLFANDRFAALVGVATPTELLGRPLAEVVHSDYQDLVREHLRRTLSGESAAERLEVELHPIPDQTARAELSCTRIDYQNAPI